MSPGEVTPRENIKTNNRGDGSFGKIVQSYWQVWKTLAIGTKTTKHMKTRQLLNYKKNKKRA